MSIKQWNAGIIRPIPVAPAGPYQDGAAPGVWTLDQVAYWQKQGLWPIAGNLAPLALFAGGNPGAGTNVIQSVAITTLGNTSDFGDLTVPRYYLAACSSAARALFAGGQNSGSGYLNVIDYVTIASAGNATDFGDINSAVQSARLAGSSNQTRGLFSGGYDNSVNTSNVISYVTIASAGNSTDFGDIAVAVYSPSSCSSTTRCLIAGGADATATPYNNIQYVTIASTGNATDFGDLLFAAAGFLAVSSNTRGVFAGGGSNVIQYVTIASTGDATDFGDLLATAYPYGAATSSQTRGLIVGGGTNTIQYITIASAGNAVFFGNLTSAASYMTAASNTHGGL